MMRARGAAREGSWVSWANGDGIGERCGHELRKRGRWLTAARMMRTSSTPKTLTMKSRTYRRSDTNVSARKWNAPTTPTILPALLAFTYSGGNSGVFSIVYRILVDYVLSCPPRDISERNHFRVCLIPVDHPAPLNFILLFEQLGHACHLSGAGSCMQLGKSKWMLMHGSAHLPSRLGKVAGDGPTRWLHRGPQIGRMRANARFMAGKDSCL